MHQSVTVVYMEWDGYRYFLALHRSGTLRAAAKILAVDQATVGRRISQLEEMLGTRLFEKRSDGYFLTLAGQRILPTIEITEDGLLAVERIIAGRDEKVAGNIRIAMPGALANHWLIPMLQPLIKDYPDLNFEFLTGPEIVNLSKREADLAVRLVKPSQKDLVVKKIGEFELGIYGHREILEKNLKNFKKENLSEFPFVGLYPKSISEMEHGIVKKIEPFIHCRIRSAAWSSVFYAIQAKLGIGILPNFVANRDENIIPIPVVDSVRVPLWIVVHPDIIGSARIRIVLDHLTTMVKNLN